MKTSLLHIRGSSSSGLFRQGNSSLLCIAQCRLEDVAIVGIGYAAQQCVIAFLNNESATTLRPLEEAALFPLLQWQVWRGTEDDYQLILGY